MPEGKSEYPADVTALADKAYGIHLQELKKIYGPTSYERERLFKDALAKVILADREANKRDAPADLLEAAIRAVDAAREDMLLAKASDNAALLRKVAIAVVHGALLAERKSAFEQGFRSGFGRSGEGWNGEYPCIDYDTDADWIYNRDLSLAMFLGQPLPSPPSSTEES